MRFSIARDINVVQIKGDSIYVKLRQINSFVYIHRDKGVKTGMSGHPKFICWIQEASSANIKDLCQEGVKYLTLKLQCTDDSSKTFMHKSKALEFFFQM